MKENRILELDALRGIAALAVVLFHFMMKRPEFNLGFYLGKMGVDLFFMISGFVIFMGLDKIKCSKDFIINRISRLYPTYIASVTFVAVVQMFFSIRYGWNYHITFHTYITNLTMFHFYFETPEIISPAWTLIIEMVFYILVLLLIQCRAIKYFGAVGLFLCLFSLVITTFFYEISFFRQLMYWVPLLQYMPLFLSGILFYKLKEEVNNKVENYCLVVFCLIAQIALYDYAGYSNFYTSKTEYSIILTSFFIFFVLLVNGQLHFIVNKVTLFLGKISFALYLIHDDVFSRIMTPILVENYHVNFWIAAFVITLPVCLFFANLMTVYIEKPMYYFLKTYLRTIRTMPSKLKNL